MTARQNVHTHLQNATAPWSSLVLLPKGTTSGSLIKPPAGFALRVIHGKKCGDSAGVFHEFARALDFPDYFGHNWDALEECLADLEWMPAKGYILMVSDAHCVIPDDEEEYETLLEVLNDAGEAWSKGQTGDGRQAPFHVLFTVTGQEKAKRKHWGLKELPLDDSAPATEPKRRAASRAPGRKK